MTTAQCLPGRVAAALIGLWLIAPVGLSSFAHAAQPIDNVVCDAAAIDQSSRGTPGAASLIATEPSETLMYEASRTTDVLDVCTRARADNGLEDYLYTWGFDEKIERMLSMDRLAFCAYDQARVLGNTILRLAATSYDPDLGQILDELARDLHAVPSVPYFDQITGQSHDKIEKVFRTQREKCGANERCRALIDGRLAALNQVRNNPNGFMSTATNGPGVYFAADPIRFLEHKKTDRDIGLVCDLTTTNLRVTDLALHQTERALEALLIRIPADKSDFPANTPPQLQETALFKRQFFEPYHNIRAFEVAAHGRILRLHNRHDIYLDKCAIEYRTSCKRLSVANLNDCSAITGIQEIIDTLPRTVDATTTGVNQNAINLGYYLIQEGDYLDTYELRLALEQRRAQRCGS